MLKVSAEFGPIDVFPPVTPRMQKEAKLFTVALLSLAVVAAAVALFRQLA